MNNTPNWAKLQYGQPSLSARLEHLIGNRLHSDFTFIIEDENVEIPAHKLIIASASPVLDRIAYGSETFSSKDFTRVDGISKESFIEILRYMYTDSININDESVFEILNKANYFGLPAVETKCLKYLRENLNSSTVPWIYHQLHTYSTADLLKKCLQYIRIEPMSFFTAEEFPNISIDAFKSIIQMDAINCTELDIFEAMIKLANAHCVANSLEPSGVNQRRMLDGAEKLLRLKTLTSCEFDKFLTLQPDFFSSNEIKGIRADIDNCIQRRKWYTYQGK